MLDAALRTQESHHVERTQVDAFPIPSRYPLFIHINRAHFRKSSHVLFISLACAHDLRTQLLLAQHNDSSRSRMEEVIKSKSVDHDEFLLKVFLFLRVSILGFVRPLVECRRPIFAVRRSPPEPTLKPISPVRGRR